MGKKIQDAIKELKEHHPYPKDVFAPLTKEERKKYTEIILKSGFSVDRYSAELMRLSWDNCIKQLELILKND